jgi:hypothetical protein
MRARTAASHLIGAPPATTEGASSPAGSGGCDCRHPPPSSPTPPGPGRDGSGAPASRQSPRSALRRARRPGWRRGCGRIPSSGARRLLCAAFAGGSGTTANHVPATSPQRGTPGSCAGPAPTRRAARRWARPGVGTSGSARGSAAGRRRTRHWYRQVGEHVDRNARLVAQDVGDVLLRRRAELDLLRDASNRRRHLGDDHFVEVGVSRGPGGRSTGRRPIGGGRIAQRISCCFTGAWPSSGRAPPAPKRSDRWMRHHSHLAAGDRPWPCAALRPRRAPRQRRHGRTPNGAATKPAPCALIGRGRRVAEVALHPFDEAAAAPGDALGPPRIASSTRSATAPFRPNPKSGAPAA